MKTNFYLLFIAIMTIPLFSSAQQIYTYAGTGVAGYTGDGGSSNGAKLNAPAWVAVDNGNNVYIADQGNNVIRKINTGGIIRTYAGNGASGFSGDGSAATIASLNTPAGIAVDGSGNIYISDEGNNRIRKINTAGVITTIAGTGSVGYSGNGNTAQAAQLNAPSGIVLDASGNIYFADRGNNVIRKINTAGIISTYAGTGNTAGYSGDGGAATAALLNNPQGLTIDASGNLYVADNANNVIRKITTAGTITTIAGTGTAGNSGDNGNATLARLNAPMGLSIDASGNVYVSDEGNHRIRKISTTGIISNKAGTGVSGNSGDGNNASLAQFNTPEGIAMDASGSLYIADNGSNVIRIVTSDIAPYFTRGAEQILNVCFNSPKPLDSMLAFNDQDAGQTETWSILQTPAHGVVSGFPNTITSNGGTIVPSGITYTPTTGYTGPDDFTVRISDGIAATVTHITVSVNPVPNVITPASQVVCANTSTNPITFNGNVNGTMYIWTNSKPSIGLAASDTGNIAAFTATNVGTSSLIGTVNVTPVINGCGGPSSSFTITVKPSPQLNHSPDQFVCANSSTNAVIFVGTTGAVFNWTNDNPAIGIASSGTGNIPSFTALNSGATASVANFSITPVANGCAGMTKYFTITVRPRPVINAIPNQVVCNGASTDEIDFSSSMTGATYNWTNNDTTIGITNNGWISIPSFTAINNTSVPVVATFNVVASSNSCPGAPASFTITVKPSPTVNNISDVSVCNGSMTNPINFSSTTSGASYSWANDNTSIGIAGTGIGNIAPFTATNASMTNMVGNITVTPSANGCTGTAKSFAITVKPTPHMIDLFDQTACNGTVVSGISFNSSLPGTTYSWANNNTSIGLGANGIGYIPSFTATNTTTTNMVGVITVTPSNNGCTGSSQSFTMTVQPSVSASTLSNVIVCNGSSTTAISLPSGSTWSNDNTTIGLPASGTGDIAAFTALNTTITPATANITVNYTGSCNTTDHFVITVNPTPSVATPADQQVCNGTATAIVAFTGTVDGTAFNWTNSNPGIGLIANGTGNIPSFVVTNTTNAPVSAFITITPSANGCNGTPHSFTISANPMPVLTSTLAPADVCDNTTFSYAPSSSVPATSFYWSRAAITGITNAASFGAGDLSEMLTNSTANPIAVTYVYTLSAGGCSNTQNVVVNIKPTPSLNSTLTPPAVCDGTVFSYVPASTTSNVSYTWTRPYMAGIDLPAGSGTGNPNEKLVNTTTGDVDVTYIYTLTANSCSAIQNVVVTTHPTPMLSTSLTGSVCSNSAILYKPASKTNNVSFTWARAQMNNVSPATGSGIGDINETLINTSVAPIDVMYAYTLNVSGCTHVEYYKLTLNPGATAPVITSLVSSSTICSNTYAQSFSAATAPAAGTTYTWSVDNGSIAAIGNDGQHVEINFMNPGTAVVSILANGGTGCSSTSSYTVNVSNSRADDPAEVIYTNSQFIALQNIEDGYQWGYDDALTLTPSVIPGALNQNYYNNNPQIGTKNYWVIIAHNGCTQKSYYKPMQAAAAAVNEDVHFYPNPVNAKINVDITTSVAGTVQVQILNMTGQLVKTATAPDSKTAVDVSDLIPGVYMIDCYRNGVKIAGSKFIKN